MDADIIQNTQDILTPYQFHMINKHTDDIKNSTLVLDLVSAAILDTLVDNSANLHDFRSNVKKESLRMMDNRDSNTDCDLMLTVLDIIGAYMNNRKLDEEASEVTMYRRFAVILDFLFDDLEMTMVDGEIISDATRLAMEQNDYEHAATFGRRIDLLMKIQGMDEPLELSSNEWKAKKTRHLKRKQQSKNIRTNCAILNRLYVTSKGQITNMMAMDFIGHHGYLYELKMTKDSYVASVVSTLLLPTDFTDLHLFKDTIKSLFLWKNFLRGTIVDLKKAIRKSDAASLDPMAPSSPPLALTTPHIFFTPKSFK